MKNQLLPLYLIAILFLFYACQTKKEPTEHTALKSAIGKIATSINGDIGISIIGINNESIEINGNKQYPLMSTFKLPIALKILAMIENGDLSLKQEILIKKEVLLENTWSPFREKHPNGNISIKLDEAIEWMVVYSDNNITDVLLQLIGGPKAVESFINDPNFVIENSEVDMHLNWDAQFKNKATPHAYTQLLKKFNDGKILNQENTHWLYQLMVNSKTGVKRLKGKLPDVTIAQRAGTSFTNDLGITGAINNVGIIELPNNQKIYIAVFIHNTAAPFSDAEALIAEIAKISYDYYFKKLKNPI